MPVSELNNIKAFFNQKKIAIIGLSRNPQHFSRAFLNELRKRNYGIIAVNPNITEIDGITCYADIKDINEPVEAAVIFVPAENREAIPEECIKKGIKYIWVYDGKEADINLQGVNSENEEIHLITGRCPMMFMPGTNFFHKLHGSFLKIAGKYPK